MITYDWDETRPGALEIDLVEHNGGSSLGHFAYTLTVTDVVTGYTRRRALLGKSQLAVLSRTQAHRCAVADEAMGHSQTTAKSS